MFLLGFGIGFIGIDRCLGMNIRWDHFVNLYDTSRYVSGADGRANRHIQFVREFAGVVSILQVGYPWYWISLRMLIILPQDKTNSVIDLYKDILRAVEDLATCSYTTEAFSELLGKVQAAVSLMSCFTRPMVDNNCADR